MAMKSTVVPGVIEMLKEDHTKVKGLFEEFEAAEGREARRDCEDRDSGVGDSCGARGEADLSSHPRGD